MLREQQSQFSFAGGLVPPSREILLNFCDFLLGFTNIFFILYFLSVFNKFWVMYQQYRSSSIFTMRPNYHIRKTVY